MAGRESGSVSNPSNLKRKRVKLSIEDRNDEKPKHYVSTFEDIDSLFRTDPQAVREVVSNLTFLRTLIRSTNLALADYPASEQLLLKYAKVAATYAKSNESNFLINIFTSWSHASNINHYELLTLIPLTMANLLSLLNRTIEFESPGKIICQLLLQHEQIKSINHGCALRSQNPACSAAALTLLAEIVAFGGGTCAQALYSQKLGAFDELDLYLAHVGARKASFIPDDGSLRHAAVRFVIANLKFQRTDTKINIFMAQRVVRAVFDHIDVDESGNIPDLLQALWVHSINSDIIPRYIKSRILTERSLLNILALCKRSARNHRPEVTKAADAAFLFLLNVCTTENRGVLLRQYGWIPPSSMRTQRDGEGESVTEPEVTRDSVSHVKYPGKVSVRNTVLASFLQELQPNESQYEYDLAIAILQSAPELVADYFLRRKSLSLEPNISARWVFNNTFIVSTIKLPVPSSSMSATWSGGSFPPASIIIESILPQPANRKSMVKCLYHSNRLVRMLSLKLLRASFLKLQSVLRFLEYEAPRWSSIIPTLIENFGRRCPNIKHIYSVFRTCSGNGDSLEEMSSAVLSMYHICLPQIAIEEGTDASAILSRILQLNSVEQRTNNLDIRLMYSVNFLHIACQSPNIRWWHKPYSISLSMFTSMLQFYTQNTSTKLQCLRGLLESTALDYSIFQQTTKISPFDTFVKCIARNRMVLTSMDFWRYLDESILRLVRRPVKYVEDLCELMAIKSGESIQMLSLLILVLNEQLPFLISSLEDSAIKGAVVEWLGDYCRESQAIGESEATIDQIKLVTSKEINQDRFGVRFEPSTCSVIQGGDTNFNHENTNINHKNVEEISPKNPVGSLAMALDESLKPSKEPANQKGIYRWRTKDISEAVLDRSVGDLIICLCSRHIEVRQQAVGSIIFLISGIEASNYKASKQLVLLLKELLETVNNQSKEFILPTFAATLAAESALILHDPRHSLYSKVNIWLHESPSWDFLKLPAFWLDKILLQESVDEANQLADLEWLLNLVFEGLQTAFDMEIYIRCKLFERLLTTLFTKLWPRHLEHRLTRILYRATFCIDSALVTRCGVPGWIKYKMCEKDSDRDFLKALTSRLKCEYGSDLENLWLESLSP